MASYMCGVNDCMGNTNGSLVCPNHFRELCSTTSALINNATIQEFITKKNQEKALQATKAVEKPIPPIKCRCCDNDRVRGSKECVDTEDHDHLECDVLGCKNKSVKQLRCDLHHDMWCSAVSGYSEWVSQFESEEDYQKSKDAAKKKEEHMPGFKNINDIIASVHAGNADIDQLRALGDYFATGSAPQESILKMQFVPDMPLQKKEELTPRNEYKYAESCGQLSLQQVQAIIDNQVQEEVDARREAHNISKSHEVECIETTQEVTMSKTNINTLPILKEDATDAGWRVAGRQFTKLTRDPIVAAIARGLGDDSEAMRAKVAAFLRTDLGTAIFQGMLSTGLSFMPSVTGDIPQRMARELRTEAMASAGDQVADLLMEPLRQVASMYLAAMPQETPALEQDTTSVKAEVTIPVSVEAKR